GGAAHGVVEVEFVGRTFAREFAQASQRHLYVARPEFDAVVEVLVFALVPHLDGAVVAVLLLADAHASRVVAVGAVRRGAAGADPLAAPLMAALLLGEALLQLLHDLVPAAQRLNLGL